MPKVTIVAFMYVLPVRASVTVVDSAFHAMGDVNWDGVIDKVDLDLISATFGSTPGAPNWNPDADLNGDGKVDISDLALAGRNYGKKAPSYVTPVKVEVTSGKCVVIGAYRTHTLKREFTAGPRVAFVFTALGLWGRVILVPV